MIVAALILSQLALDAVALGGAARPGPWPDDAVLPPVEPFDHTRLGVATPIENPPGQDALRAFRLALVDTARRADDPTTPTREDQTRIVAFGASHVAGDMFTGLIRNELKSRFGDAGLGFLVPANPWRDYYNRDANIRYSKNGWQSFWMSSRKHEREDGRYGLAGITFESSSRHAWAEIATSEGGPYGMEIDRLEIWYWKQPRGGDFVVDIDGRGTKRVKTRTDRKKKEVEGFAVWSMDLPLGRHEITIRPRGNGDVTLFGVVMDKQSPGVVMDSMGINGARATDQLTWDAGLFTQQLQRRDPDLVLLAYGTNAIGDDEPLEEYERKLDIVINRVRSAVPAASCLFVGPSDRPVKIEVSEDDFMEAMQSAGFSPDQVPAPPRGRKRLVFQKRPRQQAVITVQKAVSFRYGCGYWDWAGAMGGDLSMLNWTHADEPFGARDYVHLTKAGYERIAALFWDAAMGSFDVGLPQLAPEAGPVIRPH